MPIDPSIPLSVNTQGPDLGRVIGVANALAQFKENQRRLQVSNALREVMLNPDSVDPNTGTPASLAASIIASIFSRFRNLLTRGSCQPHAAAMKRSDAATCPRLM